MKFFEFLLGLVCIAILSCSCAPMTGPLKHNCVRYSSDHKECEFETRGTISFEQRDGRVVVDLRPRGKLQGGRAYWPPTAVPYQGVDTTRSYELKYLESKIAAGTDYRDWIDTTLLRIVDGDHTLYDASICPLHREVMVRQIEVGVSYESYHPYREQYFDGNSPRLSPNDGKAYLVCGSGIRRMIWRCPICYRISEEWEIEHGIK